MTEAINYNILQEKSGNYLLLFNKCQVSSLDTSTDGRTNCVGRNVVLNILIQLVFRKKVIGKERIQFQAHCGYFYFYQT